MSNNFKQLRIDAKLKQTEIAEQTHVSVQTVNKWERGRAPIARRHWPNLAALLKVSIDELEHALIETLLDACIEHGDATALKNAVISGLYKAELLQEALVRFASRPVPVKQNTVEIDLREENLKLREENLKLRERIFELEKQLASPSAGVFTGLKSASHKEFEVTK